MHPDLILESEHSGVLPIPSCCSGQLRKVVPLLDHWPHTASSHASADESEACRLPNIPVGCAKWAKEDIDGTALSAAGEGVYGTTDTNGALEGPGIGVSWREKPTLSTR